MRYLCDVLEEMRKCHESRNYAHLLGLIEEGQTYANRMEEGLGQKKSYEKWYKERKKIEAEVKELKHERDVLRRGLGKEVKEEEGRKCFGCCD